MTRTGKCCSDDVVETIKLLCFVAYLARGEHPLLAKDWMAGAWSEFSGGEHYAASELRADATRLINRLASALGIEEVLEPT